MAISRATIEQITLSSDLIGLVGEYVSLKKKGANWEACCPFHEEKSPSFKVNPAKGIYKCFGCGKGGDAISFVMDIESMSYVEALRFLAKKYNIAIEESASDFKEDQARQTEKESLQIVMNFAQEYFHRNLHEHPDGIAIGLSYFKERGLRADIIESFGVGYALDQWDGLMQEAAKKQYSLELLEKAGLILVNDETHKTYDRFRGRVTFPIYNVSGRVIAFGARMLGSDKNQPKYINSPESLLYDKSSALYGLYQARNAIRQADMCYLTEGYMDVIAMHQAGIAQTVASSGTSLTEGQIKLIGRFTQNLTLLYDGDKAGIKASLRGIDLIVAAGLNVRAVVLPDGHDPDSYAKAFGSEELDKYLKSHTQDFIAFKAGLAAEEAAGDPIKRAESIDSIVETISLVPDVIKRSVFVSEAARLFKMSEEALTESLNTRIYERLRKPKPRVPSSEEPPVLPPLDDSDNPYTQAFEQQQVTPLMELEQGLVRSLILYGHKPIEDDYLIAHYILEQVAELELKTGVLQKLRAEYADRLDFGDDMSPDFFLHHPEELIKRMVIDLCAEFYQLSPNWENKYKIFIPTEEDLLSTALYANILRLKKQHVLEEIKALELILENPSEEVDDMEVLKEIMEKKQVEMAISKELGSVMN
ncbi:MAG TPA: DNA primase [Catalimonadaceae bacterium]|nr:DNA primase [Catalimonadaceae bacterium]